MLRVLADAGPLVALFDPDDSDHDLVVRFLSGFSGESGTTWQVIAEVTHLLDFSVDKQAEFLEWVERGGVAVGEIGTNNLGQVIALMKKYSHAPMELADATMELRRGRPCTDFGQWGADSRRGGFGGQQD